eukprot:137096_1
MGNLNICPGRVVDESQPNDQIQHSDDDDSSSTTASSSSSFTTTSSSLTTTSSSFTIISYTITQQNSELQPQHAIMHIKDLFVEQENSSMSKYITDTSNYVRHTNLQKHSKRTAVSFNFGAKYYYWSYYKDNVFSDSGANTGYQKGDWYIHKKYQSLKEEILQNEIYALTKTHYHDALQKAQNGLNITDIKQMKSDLFQLKATGTSIKLQNLLSIVLYTNYHKLSSYLK